MQADLDDPLQSSEMPSSNRRKAYFNLKTNIDKWEDFKNTWKNVKFDETLNSMDESSLMLFWKGELDHLMNEKEKICILAPFQVSRNTHKGNQQEKVQRGVNQKNSQNIEKLQVITQKMGEPKQLQKPINDIPVPIEPLEKPKTEIRKQEGDKQNKNKNNRNNMKKIQNPKIRLNPCIFQICKKLIDESYPELSYVHESLYMGNQKQLLIYRQCPAIEKYLEKYRLPNNFKEVFGEIQNLVGQLFEVKVRRNEAISTFKEQEIARSTAEYKTVELKIQDYLSKTQDYYSKILQDFNSKKKVREILLHNIRDQLKNILASIVEKYENTIINKYNLCDNDEFKDVLIVKKNDHRLNPLIIPEEETNKKIQYVYVEPEHQLQPPRDIRQLTFQGIDLQKQCYKYKIDLPRWGKDNRLEGLFIRCPQGEGPYEKTLTIVEQIKKITVELQPYAYGKIIYQIYTWNAAGFTKSTESIVIFNQLRVPGIYEKSFHNHSLYMLGESQCGLLVDCQSTNNQFKKMNFVGTDLSVGNGAILCDAKGDCAGWGEMYCAGQNESKTNEDNQDDILLQTKLNQNIKIQSPVLLLSNKQIRKVSCGMGYFLMLSRFGAIWSMGFNHFGQLGLGNFNMDAQNMNPRQITKFTDSSSPFIVDIKASECGASFALDETGNLYRWGLNQVEVTPYPIEDRFGTTINFTSCNLLYKASNPYKVGKNYIQGNVKQIQAGNQFYLALTQEGVLYGWGDCRYLGCGPLLDPSENSIPDIINPKQIKSGFNFITSSFDHTVGITKDKRVLAWGHGKSFSNKLLDFYETPIDITDQYGEFDNIQMIKSGRKFTVVVYRDSTIKLFGQIKAFSEKVYKFDGQIVDVECCYENLISVIAEKKKL